VDETSRKLLDNVVKEDDILNENITSTHKHPRDPVLRQEMSKSKSMELM
jgi:hypothetical protein